MAREKLGREMSTPKAGHFAGIVTNQGISQMSAQRNPNTGLDLARVVVPAEVKERLRKAATKVVLSGASRGRDSVAARS